MRQHVQKSRHYTDEALDVRSHTFQTLAAKRLFRSELERTLGPHCPYCRETRLIEPDPIWAHRWFCAVCAQCWQLRIDPVRRKTITTNGEAD